MTIFSHRQILTSANSLSAPERKLPASTIQAPTVVRAFPVIMKIRNGQVVSQVSVTKLLFGLLFERTPSDGPFAEYTTYQEHD